MSTIGKDACTLANYFAKLKLGMWLTAKIWVLILKSSLGNAESEITFPLLKPYPRAKTLNPLEIVAYALGSRSCPKTEKQKRQISEMKTERCP